MNIKKIADSVLNFTIKRLIEIIGIFIFILGILLFLGLITYSPSDPNFIFPENEEIKNLLGFQGSYISDLFFQSIGLIGYLIPVTYFFTGINIFKKKELFILLESSFFVVIYSLVGSLFFSFYYSNSFILYINGSGGFVGNFLYEILSYEFLISHKNILYYFFIIIISILFLVSINFKTKNFIYTLKKLFQIITKNGSKNYTNKSEIINEYIPQEEIKNLIQEDLPFIKTDENKDSIKIKFKLPSIDLLSFPTKKERENLKKTKIVTLNFLKKFFSILVLTEILVK